MLNCWPTKNLSTINRSWEDFPVQKLDSNFIHAAENAAFLFCLSRSLEQSLTSVAGKLATKSSDEKSKIRFCSSLSMCFVKRSLSENTFTRGRSATCGRISASTWAACWAENIQEVSSSVSSLFKLKFCFLFFSCSCFSVAFPAIETGYRSSSFLNLTDAKSSSYQAHLHPRFLLNCYLARNLR